MIEYVTMQQIEDTIEEHYKKHFVVLSFYDALMMLKSKGMTSTTKPVPPDFSRWDLNDLQGLLNLFSKIPIPFVAESGNLAKEGAQRDFYEQQTTVFKQPRYMQTLDHHEHSRMPSNSVRIIYVLKGECRLKLNNWSDVLSNESVVILSSDMDILLESGRDDIILNLYIDRSHFDKSFFSGMRPDDILIPFFEQGIYEAQNGIIHFKLLKPDHVHNIYQRMMIEMCNQDDHTESIIQGYVRILCIELNRASIQYSMNQSDNSASSNGKLTQVFPAIVNYIKAHYDTVTLSDLSDVFGYESAYLSRMFKKLTGISFVSFLTQLRMDVAKQLLTDKSLKIETVAKMLGYNSYDHFARTFRKNNGMNPNEYRKHQ